MVRFLWQLVSADVDLKGKDYCEDHLIQSFKSNLRLTHLQQSLLKISWKFHTLYLAVILKHCCYVTTDTCVKSPAVGAEHASETPHGCSPSVCQSLPESLLISAGGQTQQSHATLYTVSNYTLQISQKKHNQDVLRLKHKARQVYWHLIYVLIHPVITWVFIFQCNASDTSCCDARIMGQCRGELIYLTRLNSVRLQRWRRGAQWVKLEGVNLEFKAFLPNSGEPAGHLGWWAIQVGAGLPLSCGIVLAGLGQCVLYFLSLVDWLDGWCSGSRALFVVGIVRRKPAAILAQQTHQLHVDVEMWTWQQHQHPHWKT